MRSGDCDVGGRETVNFKEERQRTAVQEGPGIVGSTLSRLDSRLWQIDESEVKVFGVLGNNRAVKKHYIHTLFLLILSVSCSFGGRWKQWQNVHPPTAITASFLLCTTRLLSPTCRCCSSRFFTPKGLLSIGQSR